ncbi:MAG: ABC transporter ATP-binding protein, partial [Thermoproteota archaeon]
MGAAIEADGLTKRFGDFTAVDHVSFTVEEGEIFGFLGPNGAGKTTTINMLITLMRPTEGTARVAGHDVVAEPDRVRERISVVFQDPTLDRRLTGWENLWIHGRLYGIPRDELAERIERAARFTEIERWLHVTVDRYSGGMMRRLEIARALLYEADVIFLDEPTVGLDPQTRARIWEYIRALRREGLTIFLTTHYMDEAERLCDRVAIIDHGRIVAMGTVDELKSIVGGEVVYVAVDPPGEAERL